MVGSAARTRVSSVTAPSAIGTLKSTRTSTRLPRTSTSLMVFFENMLPPACDARTGPRSPGPRRVTVLGRATTPIMSLARSLTRLRVAPLVVVPGEALHERALAAHDHVWSESKTDERGLPTTSMETIGSSQYSRMPFIGPSAAAFIAALIVVLGDRRLELGDEVDDRAVRGRERASTCRRACP